MNLPDLPELMNKWAPEVELALMENSSMCVAIFSDAKELLFANPAMRSLIKGEPHQSFINPVFDKLLSLPNEKPLIFEGMLTIGDYASVNTSILAQVFRKANQLLVLGGVDSKQLIDQNISMHALNREIGDLQRQLIREKHALEQTLTKLNEANTELKELDATKNKFFSIIAHDLKNPFNALLGLTEMMMNQFSNFNPDEVRNMASAMHETSRQTYTLLENLLEWSRLQTGKLNPVIEHIMPDSIVNEVIDQTYAAAKLKGISLIEKLTETKAILADKAMLNTVLRNLVTNAIKFTNYNGTITISTVLRPAFLEFAVTDTGIGIEPEHLANLFGLDCGLSKRGTANEKGTGLGLILCREFVELQQGHIWVESALGKGSSFIFTLPLADPS